MTKRTFFLIAFCSPFLFWRPLLAQNLQTISSKKIHEPNSSWKSDASNLIEESQYLFKPVDEDQYTAINQRNKLGFITDEQGYEVKQILTNTSAFSFELRFMLETVQGRPTGDATHINVSDPTKLVYNYNNLDIEYNNTPSGLRQNFIIKNKEGKGRLKVRIGVESSLDFSLDKTNALVFRDHESRKIQMVYDGLKVWDANHKPLHSSMKLTGSALEINVDDRGAKYPVTIDPLNHTYEWATSSDAILPGLLTNAQLQIDALYGYSSAGLGDINNDGYDDVAIGAPGAVDIVGANTFLQAGAVFIYYGSSSGLATTPSNVLWANTPVAGALFGYSIAAGDIVGDSRNDVIVGAPLDAYTTLAASLTGPASVTVTSGKVYIFRGEDLSNATPTPLLDVELQGVNLFSQGIAGVLGANVSVKGLFGFSVAAADDLNGDGKADLVVGTPGYLGITLLAARSGAAFVYYSDNLSTTTPVQLATPSPSLLGLATLPLANTDGLLFGFSVDGAGDFNGDGYPDVVVGAPAGVNLNSLGGIFTGKLLSGSAYVFYGNGSGITAATTTRLDPAAGGLLATVPNLQGYSVRGVRNATRQRNGRILVGAPAGNVLSNIVSGLQLKTGSVNVYKTYSAGTITPSQTITSPRGSSLLSILNGQVITVSAMFGASMDNVMDVNCDGTSDIIIGEPLSSAVGLIGANAVGGAAIVLSGNPDGTYNTTPLDMITTVTSMDIGVNAASMLGTSVSGAGLTYGSGFPPRAVVGAPGKSLDFGSGLLNLGSTLSTLWSFTSTNNGVGKAFEFSWGSCSILPATLMSFQGVKQNDQSVISWSTSDEINIKQFQVTRSTDGDHYSVVGTMSSNAAKARSVNKYKWIDETPAVGINYYRLRIVDNDGKVTLSGIVQLNYNADEAASIKVTPNPVIGSLINIRMNGLKQGSYRVDLASADGRRVQSVTANVGVNLFTLTLNRKNLPAGLYSVNTYDNTNKLLKADRIVILDY